MKMPVAKDHLKEKQSQIFKIVPKKKKKKI